MYDEHAKGDVSSDSTSAHEMSRTSIDFPELIDEQLRDLVLALRFAFGTGLPSSDDTSDSLMVIVLSLSFPSSSSSANSSSLSTMPFVLSRCRKCDPLIN